ncbi:DUF4302 domain-containing protein [Belliella marina]|uniref:DUF4302 domain-containing protein n=1 Tax=Belliella marina TaxID=1644146 RepID=A0ABW4VI45_9BACT
MKKLKYIYSFLFVLGLFGCDLEEELVLDNPDERLIANLEELQEVLQSADNGWIGRMYPSGGKGFSFFFEFGANGRVKMLSDFSDETATETRESTYRLKALQRPTVIFDTYNYIHLIADPDESINGGTRGSGLDSDFEFATVSVSSGQIDLEGVKKGSKMTLYAATSAQATAWKDGEISTMFSITRNYLGGNGFPYVDFGDGIRQAVDISLSNKTFQLSYIDGDGQSVSLEGKFAFTLEGLSLGDTLEYEGKAFGDIIWDVEKENFYLLIEGEKLYFSISPTPIIPLATLLGYGKQYTMLTYNPSTVSPLPSVFLDVFAAGKAGLAGLAGRNLNRVEFTFTNTNEAILNFAYNNVAGSNFNARTTYRILTDDEGNLSFEFMAQDNNTNVVGSGLAAIKNYFESNTFKIDWAAGDGNLYGALVVVDDPGSYFYGTF